MASSPQPDPIQRHTRFLAAQAWLDVGRAAAYLALARWVHRRETAAGLLRLARKTGKLNGQDDNLARRIALATPRAARRVPWRSDCFVQALAAQAWLARRGLGSELFIGVRKDDGGFAAHAWLRHGEITVTGGDFSSYQPIVTPDTPLYR